MQVSVEYFYSAQRQKLWCWRSLPQKAVVMTALLLNACFSFVHLANATEPANLVRPADRPNVVFILADDLGYGDVGCFGRDRCRIETPHIDALAASGIRFTNAHVNASVCGPTRLAIMTGRYPWRFGPAKPGGPWGFIGLRVPTETYTIADLMNQAGYATGYVGKWHLGTTMATKDGKLQNEDNVDYKRPLLAGPNDFGWQETFILPGSLDMYPYVFAKDGVWQGDVNTKKGWSAFNRVGDAAEDFEDHKVLETFYQQAESFIGQQSDAKPFFLFLALTAPHTPTSPSAEFRGRSELGIYGDFVMEVDHAVERVVRALEEQGLRENTLILFTSDHGPAPYAGNILESTPGQIHQMEAAGHFPSGPYRGYKFSVYEGGLRVPMVASWPAKMKSGRSTNALIGLCDLMATLGELSGQDLQPDQGVDSISFAKLLRDPSVKSRRQDLVMQSIGPFAYIHEQWKLCVCPGSGATGKFGNTPSMEKAWSKAQANFSGEITREGLAAAPFVQLFDLGQDPGERNNLAGGMPEKVAELVGRLRSQIANGRSTKGPKQSNSRNMTIFQRLPGEIRKQINN
ncbi:MAG: sulfatase-like hydrolase/transferase [Planctomycetota bacterium]